MSTYLKHIEIVDPLKSSYIFLNDHKFYLQVSDELIDFKIKKFLNEKIDLFYNKLKIDAPHEDIIGYLCDYELINTNLDCGGYCDFTNKKIAYKSGGIKTIFHEVSHAFQAELEFFEKDDILLSKEIYIEQQCETMAYYLYNAIYKNNQIDCTNFDSYMSIDHVNFLSNWYGDYKQNDLIIK